MLVLNYLPDLIQGPNLFTGRYGKQGYFNCEVTRDSQQFSASTDFKCLLISFYHYYLWHHDNRAAPSDQAFHQLLSNLDPVVLGQLQHGNASVVIDASYENFSYPIVMFLNEVFSRLDIRLDRLTVIFPTAHAARLARHKFPDSTMKFCGVNTFEVEAFQNLTWNRKRRFLLLNNRYSVDRAWMFFKSWQAGILDRSYATFGVRKFDHLFNSGTSFVPQVKTTISEEVRLVYDDPDLAEFIKYADDTRIPYRSDLHLTDSATFGTNYSEFLLAHHHATHLAMISESYESPRLDGMRTGFDGMYFPTEKTFRTIGMSQPFLVYSSVHFLRYLREQGYQTFGSVLDESYDELADDRQRQQGVFNELNRLDKLADHEFYPLINQLNEIARFNHGHFMARQSNPLHCTYFEDLVLQSLFQIPRNSG